MYLSKKICPLPVISPLVHWPNKHRLLFIIGGNPRDLSRTFCNLKPTLSGFCLGLNAMDACGSTTMRKVPANLIATIFLKIYLPSQVTKDSHFEKVFESQFLIPDVKLLLLFLNFLITSVCQHGNCFWCSLHPFTDWTRFFRSHVSSYSPYALTCPKLAAPIFFPLHNPVTRYKWWLRVQI